MSLSLNEDLSRQARDEQNDNAKGQVSAPLEISVERKRR
jgi:hypothetical protein